jgi:hypothetical protein
MASDEQIGFVFGFANETKQIMELCEYLVLKGADKMKVLDIEKATDISTVTAKQLHELIPFLDVLAAADITDVQVEHYLNSVLSLLSITVRSEDRPALIREFSAKLATFTGQGWASRAGAAIRVLSNLFYGLHASKSAPQTRFHIYDDLVTLCAHAKLIAELPTDLAKLTVWFAEWNVTVDNKRALLRKLYDALGEAGDASQSATIMLALLDTYDTKEAAKEGLKDAHACVCTAIKDENVFVMDHLLRLKSVQMLKQSDAKLWQLLDICVSGTLTQYEAFTKANPTFVKTTIKADEAVMRHKMQVITLISIAEHKNTITFEEVRKAVAITTDEQVEEFVIDAIQAKAIKARIDNCTRTVIVRDAVYRHFDVEQWRQLRGQITHWHTQMVKMSQQLAVLPAAQA